MSGCRRGIAVIGGAGIVLAAVTATQGEVQLLGVSRTFVTAETQLVEVDPGTGAASGVVDTGQHALVGITASPSGTLYSLSTFGIDNNPNSVFTIDRVTGVAQLVGPTGLENIFEGDLDFDPTTGILYAVQDVPSFDRLLFTIDTATGAATTVGSLGVEGTDYSAMAFNEAGILYILDTTSELLLTVDPSDASIETSLPLIGPALGILAGMDFHPETGGLYVADGGTHGTDTLYTLDTTTGVLTTIGPTGLAAGISGLEFIPEPATGLLVALGATLVLRRRRRPE